MSGLLKIYDTTLRDGTQGEGISFSVADKLLIAGRLDQFGVDYIEGGFPGSNPRDISFFAEAKQLSIRELMIEVMSRPSFIGTPEQVATQIDRSVQERAADGFILVPHLTPGGLGRFADEVVPILQERGRFRTEYDGPTLRDHLGLPAPTTRRATARTSA